MATDPYDQPSSVQTQTLKRSTPLRLRSLLLVLFETPAGWKSGGHRSAAASEASDTSSVALEEEHLRFSAAVTTVLRAPLRDFKVVIRIQTAFRGFLVLNRLFSARGGDRKQSRLDLDSGSLDYSVVGAGARLWTLITQLWFLPSIMTCSQLLQFWQVL